MPPLNFFQHLEPLPGRPTQPPDQVLVNALTEVSYQVLQLSHGLGLTAEDVVHGMATEKVVKGIAIW